MQKAGGIIALVASVFGTVAILVMEAGMVDVPVEAVPYIPESEPVVFLVGLLFSVATIILAAFSIKAKDQKVGVALVVCATVGMLLGSFLFMLWALIGGILATMGVSDPDHGMETDVYTKGLDGTEKTHFEQQFADRAKCCRQGVVWAVVLGGLGAHRFYMGRTGLGVLYAVFVWTLIPAIVGFIEGCAVMRGRVVEHNEKLAQELVVKLKAVG